MYKDEANYILSQSLDPEMPILNRKLPRPKHGTGGRVTNLTQGVWFDALFELNEKNAILGNYQKIITDAVILANWAKEYEGKGINPKTGLKIGGGLTSGKLSIGMYRNKYRNARLYDTQIKPYLISLKYCSQKYPCREKTKAVIPLTLDEIRELCMQCKIADPRFFTPKEIADIKTYADKNGERNLWGIPAKSQWEELNKSVPGGIYGRYKLYNEVYDPTSWSPLTW
jgi:hypothetical protein